MYNTVIMAAVGTLEDEALKRKERLKNLRNKTNKNESDNSESDKDKEKLPKPVFRSYKPVNDSLKDSSLPQTKPADVTEKIQGHIEATKTDTVIEEVDLVNLAPRKPDWDLKRDVAKKLEKLERRTQRAIAELIRERLKKSGEDLAQVVSAATANDDVDDDDD
ncbi:coiled-coil domain-containing protein 12-like [Ruditapes philippinarum]|uniref:coiled-coil domain-containing protein 12-like n=1 Tax=Ruditapes philippinarum TaxID=129788 RepID=UPI00295AD087|nr:coiled-coil domain-containing protein 12-like [Ruditapes philippinarum]